MLKILRGPQSGREKVPVMDRRKQPIVDVSYESPAERELAVSERANFFESRD